MERELEEIFIRQRLRLTKPRRIIFNVMHATDTPLSIAAIAKLCPSVERTSVYRTLELFVQLGIVETVARGWKQQYELASPFNSHHHHLTCSLCGKVIDIYSKKFEMLVGAISHENQFVAQDHTLEIRGHCVVCR